jgi:hypothetical protein
MTAKGTDNMAGKRNTKKIAISVLALGAASAAVVFGSYAAWTAQTTNPGNSVATGSLTMTNSKDASAVFAAATDAKPGDTGGSTVTLTNTGTTALSSVQLTQNNITNTVGATMELQIHDDTTNRCIWPTDSAGACGGYGTWNAGLTSFNIKDAGGATDNWAVSEAHTFTVNWRFNSSAGNATQSQNASFDLVWDGVQ